MLGYKSTTAVVTNIALSGIFPNLGHLLITFSHYGLHMAVCKSRYFFVGILQFELTGLPGAFGSFLWILGSRYNFPRLQVF